MVDGGLLKFDSRRFEHVQSSCLTCNNYQCIVACCTLMSVSVLHCSACFHDCNPANPFASQVSSSVAAGTSDDKLLSMSPQLSMLILWL